MLSEKNLVFSGLNLWILYEKFIDCMQSCSRKKGITLKDKNKKKHTHNILYFASSRVPKRKIYFFEGECEISSYFLFFNLFSNITLFNVIKNHTHTRKVISAWPKSLHCSLRCPSFSGILEHTSRILSKSLSCDK